MSVCDRTANRKGAFKKTVTSDDCRRKREEKMVSVRKNKREEKLRKRRNMKAQNVLNSSDEPSKQGNLPSSSSSTTLLDLATLSRCKC